MTVWAVPVEHTDTVVDDALFWLTDHAAFVFDGIRLVLEGLYDGTLWLLRRDDGAGLAAGAPADIVLLDATAPHMLPLVHRADRSNLMAGIVFSGSGRDVTDVMAGGRWVVRDRRPVALDVERAGADLAAAADLHPDGMRGDVRGGERPGRRCVRERELAAGLGPD
mgnify:CR=1 FL=1